MANHFTRTVRPARAPKPPTRFDPEVAQANRARDTQYPVPNIPADEKFYRVFALLCDIVERDCDQALLMKLSERDRYMTLEKLNRVHRWQNRARKIKDKFAGPKIVTKPVRAPGTAP